MGMESILCNVTYSNDHKERTTPHSFKMQIHIPCYPVLSCKGYQKTEREIGKKVETAWHEESKKRHQEECAIAELDEEGLPSLTVAADGGWLKQSRGHSHTSTSGTSRDRHYC